jgi:dihydrodipicolinate synthase/N-acetylneuraminate lyase
MLAVKRHIALTREFDRVYLSGSELNFVQFMQLGGHGCVSAGSLFLPRTAVAMYEAYLAGDTDKASQLQSQLFETMPLLKNTSAPVTLARPMFLQALKQGLDVPVGIESTHARLKAALARRGIPIRPVVRTPLPQLSRRDQEAVEQVIKKIEQIEPIGRR